MPHADMSMPHADRSMPHADSSTSVAVIFSGLVRGDARVWANLRENLIRPAQADVYGAFWHSPHSVECLKQALMLDRFMQAATGASHDVGLDAPKTQRVEFIQLTSPADPAASIEHFAEAYNLTGEAAMLARAHVRAIVPQVHAL